MIKLGVAGDSASDSYQADDNRGNAYHNVTFAWTDWGVRFRRWDLGAWGSYAEPRRTDYAQNWARSAAMWDNHLNISGAVDLLGSGQIDGLVPQVTSGAVDYVVMFCGANDWTARNIPSGWPPLGSHCLDDIYNGTMNDAQILDKADRNIANQTTAINALQSAGADGILLVSVDDMRADTAHGQTADPNYPDPVKWQRVTDSIQALNVRMQALATSKGIAYGRYIEDIIGPNVGGLTGDVPPQLPQWLGPNLIADYNDNPQHLLLADFQHAGSIMQTWTANMVIHVLNARYNLGIEPIWPWLPNRDVGIAPGITGSIVRS